MWESNVHKYLQQHPSVKLIDRVDGIKTLQNRATMLSPLHGGGVNFKVTRHFDVRAKALQRIAVDHNVPLQWLGSTWNLL